MQKADRHIVGASGQLQWSWRSDRAQLLPEPQGGTGRPSPHIPAHRPAIQLPEGSHALSTQSAMTMPELPGQNSWGDSVTFHPAADSQATQGNLGRSHRKQRAFESRASLRCRVNFQSIRLQLLKQLTQPLESDLVLLGVDELLGTGRKTAPTSITNAGLNAFIRSDGVSGADPFTRPRAVGGAQRWVKDSLAKMNIGSVTDADHQPGRGSSALSGAVQSEASRMNHRRIGRDIHAMHTRSRVHSTQVAD